MEACEDRRYNSQHQVSRLMYVINCDEIFILDTVKLLRCLRGKCMYLEEQVVMMTVVLHITMTFFLLTVS